MGKTSKVEYPQATESSLSVNGMPLVQTSINGGSISSNYNFTPEQNAMNNYVQASLLTNVPKINTFLPQTIENLSLQVEAYKNNGVNTINELYPPMIKGLQNEVANRFGNLDNSIFMENLNGLETKRASAVSALAQDVEAKRNELVNDELQKQYDFLNFLTDYQNQTFQNMLNATQLNKSNLSLNNDYQTKIYNASDNQADSALGAYSSLKDILKSFSSTAKI